jgi:hypothetical protein
MVAAHSFVAAFLTQSMNIYELIRGRRHYVCEERVRSYMYQLTKALDHMHRNGIFHRCDMWHSCNAMPYDILDYHCAGWCLSVGHKEGSCAHAGTSSQRTS